MAKKKMLGIIFSYWDDSHTIHKYGMARIPEDISEKEAEKLVKEGKAQYEDLSPYYEEEEEDFDDYEDYEDY